jgi:acyl carrier protein
MDDLEAQLKRLIIDTLELEDIEVSDIVSEQPLFDEDAGLGLDSIDALEIGLALAEKYDVELDGEDEATREYFRSVASLANFVRDYQAQRI